MKLLRIIILLITFSSCAQIVPPTGGNKDIKPPILIKSNPNNGSINLLPKKIFLTFNENITLKNKQTNITLTPDINVLLSIEAFNNKIEITIPTDSLLKKMTYSINFNKSIADLNEGNILNNLTYTFSTGNVLDSISLIGIVNNIKDKSPVENVRVILQSDSSRVKYSTNSNSEGSWKLSNISKGGFSLLLFKDLNSNNHLDNGEFYFYKSIYINDSSKTIKSELIYFNKSDSSKTKVISVNFINDNLISVKLNNTHSKTKNLKFSINSIENNKKQFDLIPTKEKDSFLCFHPKIDTDTILFSIQTDTIQNFKILQNKKREEIKASLSPKSQIIAKSNPVVLTSSIPLMNINSKKIKINGDSLSYNVKLKFPYSIIITHGKMNRMQIILEPGAFTDINGMENQLDTFAAEIASTEQTGNYTFIVRDSSDLTFAPLLIKISNELGEKIFKSKIGEPIKLVGYLPGNYTIELIRDANNNGIWDEGNYYKNQWPEKILILKEFITIKPNHDTEGVEIYMH